ncbi:ABC transporter substrate-binding protein [bacterium]|nr:ABC transporter substrate-binding protein [bacterium]
MKRLLLALIAIVVILYLPSCKKENPVSEEILIGEYGSLTGTTATYGISVKNGIDMAIRDVNAAGGVLGKKIRVIVEDDQGKPEEAQTVVTRLITKNRVVAVLGEVSSSRSLAAAPVCQQNRIPMITPSSTNPRVTTVGDYIFRVCFIDTFQGFVMAQFVSNNLKLKNVAILRDIKNDYSVGLADVFTEEFQKRGGRIVSDESYSEGDNDFNAQLTLIKSKNPEAIFIPGYYTEAGLIARQARNLGIQVPLLGGDGWDSGSLWEIGGTALNNSYYSSHYAAKDPNPVVQKFVQDYKKQYGQLPDTNAVLGYDAASLLFDAFRRSNSVDPARVRDALASTKDFIGVTGKIEIDENRNPRKQAIILKVRDGEFDYVETIPPQNK